MTINGKVEAVGFGYPNLNTGDSVGASSGGSINLTVASLSGAGEINADGGCDQEGGNGSGGRIRVKLTSAKASFNEFTGSIHAYGGTKRDGGPVNQVEGVVDAAAGTVVRQLASDPVNGGTLVISNVTAGRINSAGATHFPAMQDSETKLYNLAVEVAAGTNVRLTKMVNVASLKVNGVDIAIGLYTAQQLNALTSTEQFSGPGQVFVGKRGLAIVIQ